MLPALTAKAEPAYRRGAFYMSDHGKLLISDKSDKTDQDLEPTQKHVPNLADKSDKSDKTDQSLKQAHVETLSWHVIRWIEKNIFAKHAELLCKHAETVYKIEEATKENTQTKRST